VVFSPSGSELAIAWEGGVVRVHEWDTGNLKLEIVTGSGFLNDIAFSPDGRYLVTAEGWPTFVSRVWDARTGEPLRILLGHTAPVAAVAFNSRGTAIVTASDTVRLWDVSDLAGRLTLGVVAGRHQLGWSVGELQHASSPAGPWKTMDGARSPWTVPPEASLEFFRTFIRENP
jgi:WD40 repeat protein